MHRFPLTQVSLAYDVDLSDDGMLGAGAYGTVMAAVHRSTGRQVSRLSVFLFLFFDKTLETESVQNLKKSSGQGLAGWM